MGIQCKGGGRTHDSVPVMSKLTMFIRHLPHKQVQIIIWGVCIHVGLGLAFLHVYAACNAICTLVCNLDSMYCTATTQCKWVTH